MGPVQCGVTMRHGSTQDLLARKCHRILIPQGYSASIENHRHYTLQVIPQPVFNRRAADWKAYHGRKWPQRNSGFRIAGPAEFFTGASQRAKISNLEFAHSTKRTPEVLLDLVHCFPPAGILQLATNSDTTISV